MWQSGGGREREGLNITLSAGSLRCRALWASKQITVWLEMTTGIATSAKRNIQLTITQDSTR